MNRKGSRYHASIPSGPWRALRRFVFARDNGLCFFCGLPAILRQAHHLVHLEDGGAPLDPANIVTTCGPCHRQHHRAARLASDPERAEWQRYLDSIR